MKYEIESTLKHLPKHQRQRFAGQAVTHFIGQYNIVSLVKIRVSEEFYKIHKELIDRLAGRGEIAVRDISEKPKISEPKAEVAIKSEIGPKSEKRSYKKRGKGKKKKF